MPPLVGRTNEGRVLESALGEVLDGHARVLVVRGDAGMGKTALLQHLTASAPQFRTVLATGVESEMALPHAGLHQLCGSMLDHLDSLPGPQRDAARAAFGLAAGTSPEPLMVGLATLSLLTAVSDERPLLSVIDDAHWLDRESLQALAFVARRLLAEPVCLAFATRISLTELAGLPELVVEPLAESDAQTLLGAVLRVPLDDRVRDRIVNETHGNPLALVEWPRGLTLAELAGGFGMPSTMAMTGQIEENFRRRLAELPWSTQVFLTVAAAEPTGDALLVWRAARALGVEADDATPAVNADLVEIGVRLSFRHPLVRTAAYRSAAPADRQAAHRALADCTDERIDPDRRAWHRALGSPGPDEDIAAALESTSARARARGGLAAAGALLERSAALTLDGSRRGDRILASADAYQEAGSFDLAARLLANAESLELGDAARAHVALLRAREATFGGKLRDAPDLLLRAATLLEIVDVGYAEVAYAQAMAVAQLVGNLTSGAGLREAAEAALRCSLPPQWTPKEWLLTGIAQFTTEGLAVAAPALREALTPVDEEIASESIHWHAHQLGAANIMWDVEAHLRLAELQVAEGRELGALTMLPIGLNSIAHARLFQGELEAAELALAEATQIISATGSGLPFTTELAILAAMRGSRDVDVVIDTQIAESTLANFEAGIAAALWARVISHNSVGRYDDALAAALEASMASWPHGEHLYWPELVEAAARCGRTLIGAQTVARLRQATEPTGSEWAMGVLRRSEALLAEATAEALYREAVERLEKTTVRLELARSHLLYGEWLRRQNRRLDARTQLRSAHEMYTTMGLDAFADRARRELLATGETIRKRTVDSRAELTPQEEHIARLAASGRTNPEIGAQLFISSRTVEWHLRKVFTKLDVTSRRELRNAFPNAGG
jgi:DNA-binding CsgD family transcriptional regulator